MTMPTNMTLDDIAETCKKICNTVQPTTIYFAIGCGLERYEEGKHPPQQYPPFMAGFPGRHVCILMDPLLESPPKVFADLAGVGVQDEEPITEIGNVTFITARTNFEWESTEARAFIIELCTLCVDTPTRLIVQDYAGHIIDHHYPIDRLGTQITKRVLFDVTYRDGGCFIDFDAVKILRYRDGGFVQPKYDPITALRAQVSPEQLRYALKERRSELVNYVKRYHRIQSGVEEYRDWCTAEVVYRHMRTLCDAYHIRPEPSIRNIEDLMVAYLFDLCAAVGDRVTETAALELARCSGKEYEHMLLALEDVLLSSIA